MGGWVSIVSSLVSTAPWWAILLLVGVLLGGGMILKYQLLKRALDKGEPARDVAELARALGGGPRRGGTAGLAARGRNRRGRRGSANTDGADAEA